jgi:hypothetical protein
MFTKLNLLTKKVSISKILTQTNKFNKNLNKGFSVLSNSQPELKVTKI